MESAEYDIMFRVEDTHWWYRALRRILLHHLRAFLPGWRELAVLDGGCGTGANLICLGAATHHVGLDRAPEAIAYCVRRGLNNLVRGDVAALPFRCNAFHAVVSASVIYHRAVPDVRVAIKECHRVLNDGGLLLLDVPAFRFLTSPHDEFVHTARRFNRRQIVELLTEHGFQVKRISYWNTLLFPWIWCMRRSGISRSGRDFGGSRGPPKGLNMLLDLIMQLEFLLFRRVCLPFGVSLSCVAIKQAASKGI